MNDVDEDIRAPETPILIVDDSAQYAMVLNRILSGVYGYQNITTVDDPEKALKLIQENPETHKLLFVDYNFPSGETGGKLLTRLAHEQLLSGKIAFLITSEPTPENMKEALDAGALGVVAKPFDRSELGRQLDKAYRHWKTGQGDNW